MLEFSIFLDKLFFTKSFFSGKIYFLQKIFGQIFWANFFSYNFWGLKILFWSKYLTNRPKIMFLDFNINASTKQKQILIGFDTIEINLV